MKSSSSKSSKLSNSKYDLSTYTALKLAPPSGPQFQLKLYDTKNYSCKCPECNHEYYQSVQKGVDIGYNYFLFIG